MCHLDRKYSNYCESMVCRRGQIIKQWVFIVDSFKNFGNLIYIRAYYYDDGHVTITCLSLGLKQPGREVDNSPPPSVKVKECVGLKFYSPNTS
jgi:hypothetical protein